MWIIILLSLGVVAIVFFLLYYKKRNETYIKFVATNSVAISRLRELNKKYHFHTDIKSFDKYHTYDNKKFFDTISCQDFLIYDLQFNKYAVENEIRLIKLNKDKYEVYNSEIKKIKPSIKYADYKEPNIYEDNPKEYKRKEG